MAVPLITVGSYQQIDITSLGGSISLPISAAGNDRIVFITNTSKDNSSPASATTSIIFDSAGVNLSIGAGVTEQGTRQIAQESTFSSQCSLWLVKESDLPINAGIYTFDMVSDSQPQYGFWEVWEVTGASDILDAITEISDIVDVPASTIFSASVNTTVPDCLVMDMWSTSHSSQPTYTIFQNQLGTQNRTNGGVVISWLGQATPGNLVMRQISSTFHQRRAGKVISIAPVAGTPPLDSNISITHGNSLSSIQASIEEKATISVILGNSITNINVFSSESITLDIILENSITSILSEQVNNSNINNVLGDSITNILSGLEKSASLDIVLGNAVPLISLATEKRATLNNILGNSTTSIVASEIETVFISVQLEPAVTSIQAESIINANNNITLDDTVVSIFSSAGNSASMALDLVLENSISILNTTTEMKANLGLILGDAITSIVALQDYDVNVNIVLEDSQVNISVSGVLIKNGQFIKIIDGHEVVVKKVSGDEIFTKMIGGHEVFTKRVAA